MEPILKNLLLDEKADIEEGKADIEEGKVDIEEGKVDIEEEKVDIEEHLANIDDSRGTPVLSDAFFMVEKRLLCSIKLRRYETRRRISL